MYVSLRKLPFHKVYTKISYLFFQLDLKYLKVQIVLARNFVVINSDFNLGLYVIHTVFYLKNIEFTRH